MKKREPVRSPGTPPGSEDEPAVQTIWSGTISFSLVAIPVQLVRAVETGRVSFHMLHRADFSPLRRRMFCPKEEVMVPPDEMIRGYEIGPDKYVLISDEELDSVSPERSRTIEIVEFIDIKEIDPVYFDHPYYLLPAKGGEKAYQLLAEAMRRTHRAGLAKFVLDEREYLVAVKSSGGALVLITLHYRDEVVPGEEIPGEEGAVEAGEKDRMKREIRKMMTDFAPERYADERRQRILDLLKKKTKARALVEAPEIEEEETEGPADLIAALEESMRKMKKHR